MGRKKKDKDKMIKIEGEDDTQVQTPETHAEETGENTDDTQNLEESAEAETAAADEKAPEADAEEADADAEETDADTEEEEPLTFGKKPDKKDQLIEELQDKLTRRMAEFDNFRKRTEKEKSQMYSMGARDVLEKMLDVLDNFERGFSAVEEEDQDDACVQGMQMVYKQMLEVLDKLGVTPIEAVGKPFDPNYHNAVMHEENEEAGENEVVEEFQKGYMYHDDVIRHSMVKVAN